MSFLQLKDIHKSYYLGTTEFPVLKGLNLNFELGEFVSILGESGGGKSTLMNIIGGLDREFEGQVLVQDQLLDHNNEKALDTYRRATIGYIYQAYNLINHLNVLDNVLISLDMTTLSKNEREQRAHDLLNRVGLAEQAQKYPNQLSGGQKQRVAIARALASDPQVIIADEPTGALDAQNTEEVLELLNTIAQEGRLVITVTHSQSVADTGTRIVHLADGKIDDDKTLRPIYQTTAEIERLESRKLPASVSYKTAFKHFKFNFWRNSLIVLGTAIGLFAVILFSGLGNGISGYISQQITNMANPQVITTSRYSKSDSSSTTKGMPTPPTTGAMTNSTSTSTGTTTTFSDNQKQRLANLNHVTSVENSYSISNVKITENDKSVAATTMSNWTKSATNSSIKIGHQPKQGEIVLDKSAVAKKISKKHWRKLIGKTVTISYKTLNKDNKYVTVKFDAKVAGIGESSTGITSLTSVNTNTLINAMHSQNVTTNPTSLAVKVDHLDNVKSVTKQINKLTKNDKRVYSATSTANIVDTVQTYINLASTLLAAIAAISLVVSALMIIVTMYMSVSARTKEIGILRALGESKSDIRRLFISESLIIGLLSAVLATGLALGVGAIANKLLMSLASYSFVQITGTNILTTFVIAIVIALLAAFLPARHAANLNPIDALSAE